MLAEPAQVLAIDPDAIFLATSRKAACGNCSANRACGSYLAGRDTEVLRLDRPRLLPQGVAAGGNVIIGMQEGAIAVLALAFYALPLLAMLLATAVTAMLTAGEGWLVLGAAGGLFAGLRLVSPALRVLSRDGHCSPALHAPGNIAMVPESSDES